MSRDLRLSSIHELYMAMARGEVAGFTVPAFNLRGMTEELAQGIFEAAKETETGAIILEIARSEMTYTKQPPHEFVRRVLIGADRAHWTGPIFIQGDHSQAKADIPGKIAPGEMEKIKNLIDVEIEAGFFNIDIDASTLVDVSLPTVTEQQMVNATVTAELAGYIRERQPIGCQISIGGEIGHIGDKNSSEEDLNCFMQIFREKYDQKNAGLSKVSVQTGTSHGGRMLSDGRMEQMSVDFQVIDKLSRLSRKMGMAGVVQHGASTLPESMFGEFPKYGANEIHLSTGWQNMIMDNRSFPPDLKKDIYEWVKMEKGGERKSDETDDQFFYKYRKYAWGEFKDRLDMSSNSFKQTIINEMKNRCIALFRELKVNGTAKVVDKYIKLPVQSIQDKKIRMIDTVDVRGKKVIVRVDWNVTFGKALQIVDDTRIVRTIPTIKWLIEHGAKQVVLLSHLGKSEEKKSLESVGIYASKLIGSEVVFCPTFAEIKNSAEQIVLLENLRLWEGEDKNDLEFAKDLSILGDIYVNEAFGESHREVASIVGITHFMPSYAGLWLEDEVKTIMRVRREPERPFVVVMGGAKVDDKIKLIEVLSQQADTILLGGKLANEYVQKGMSVSGKARILTPSEGSDIKDIGIKTQERYSSEIALAKLVVWNGPMGMVEDEKYKSGTLAIYQSITENEDAYTVVGGGDTLASIGKLEHLSRIDHVSTGGGAMLKLLETGSLIGVEVLKS